MQDNFKNSYFYVFNLLSFIPCCLPSVHISYTTSVDSFHYDNLLKVCLFNHLGALSGKCNQYLGEIFRKTKTILSLGSVFTFLSLTMVITDTISGVRGIRKQEGRVGRKEKN